LCTLLRIQSMHFHWNKVVNCSNIMLWLVEMLKTWGVLFMYTNTLNCPTTNSDTMSQQLPLIVSNCFIVPCPSMPSWYDEITTRVLYSMNVNVCLYLFIYLFMYRSITSSVIDRHIPFPDIDSNDSTNEHVVADISKIYPSLIMIIASYMDVLTIVKLSNVY
jgi:hypothetical protein